MDAVQTTLFDHCPPVADTEAGDYLDFVLRRDMSYQACHKVISALRPGTTDERLRNWQHDVGAGHGQRDKFAITRQMLSENPLRPMLDSLSVTLGAATLTRSTALLVGRMLAPDVHPEWRTSTVLTLPTNGWLLALADAQSRVLGKAA